MKVSIGVPLQATSGQIAEVQESQGKMWDAINQMGGELWELAGRESNSDLEDEGLDPKGSYAKAP